MLLLFFTLALGKPVDATQELLAIGLCNIGNSFFHSFPGTGSFSRSAVNAASGVRTPMGGLYSGEIIFFKNQLYNSILYFVDIVRFKKCNSLCHFYFLGILVIVALLFCTPYFYYIPKSALAAIIIAAVIFMVEIRVVKPIYRSKSNIILYLFT